MATPSPARMHEFEVVTNEPLADATYRLVMRAPKLAHALKPGQFVNIQVPGVSPNLLRVPLSFARTDTEAGTVEIWYAVVGDGTERLSAMKPGEVSNLLGPGGKGWGIPEGCKRALVVGGGIGVPPVLALAKELAAQGVAFDAVIGAATAGKVVGEADFKALDAENVIVATDDGTAGEHAFATDVAARLMDEHAYDYVATCGPAIMMHKVADAAIERGIFCEASLERMMSCGFGACNTCNVETVDGMKGACMCGPVFDATKVVVW